MKNAHIVMEKDKNHVLVVAVPGEKIAGSVVAQEVRLAARAVEMAVTLGATNALGAGGKGIKTARTALEEAKRTARHVVALDMNIALGAWVAVIRAVITVVS